MKKMKIFEPAMCCSTGLCGVGVDPELLRISTVVNALEKNNVSIQRVNLSDAPQEFITNTILNEYIKDKGVEGLPVTILDNEIVIEKRYPTNEEFVQLLEVPESFIEQQMKEEQGCGCECACEGEDCNC